MKKIYSRPEACVFTLNMGTSILAGSPGLQSSGYNAESESLSRESFGWDDEE